MNINAFLEYARAELSTIKHPYCDRTERIKNAELSVWIIDSVLRRGMGPHEALAENFYQALGDYLNAPRQQKAVLRGSIEKLAVQFETFLRTTIRTALPDKDVVIYDRNGKSRGKLSQSGYLPDFLKHICGIEANFWESKSSYWQDKSVEEAVYGVCFRHQQRAKHEARNYTLSQLESLATQILGAYLFFAEWLAENSDLEKQVRERQEFARNEALLYWPEILGHQLELAYISLQDQDLQEMRDKLMGQLSTLVEQAKQFREQGIDPESKEVTELYQAIESLAEEYKWLVTDSNMREYGREQEADKYM